MDRIHQWLLAPVIGIVVGGSTFLFGNYPSLTVALAVVYTVGTWLFVEYASILPGGYSGDNWWTTRWHSVFIWIMPPIALLVATSFSSDLGTVLLLLVIGVGWMGLLFGIATAREQAAANESAGESGPVNEPEQGDYPGTNTEKA